MLLYQRVTKGYFFYNKKEQRVLVSRDVVFIKNEIIEFLDKKIDLREVR